MKTTLQIFFFLFFAASYSTNSFAMFEQNSAIAAIEIVDEKIYFDVESKGDKVFLSWEVKSNELQSIVVERSINSQAFTPIYHSYSGKLIANYTDYLMKNDLQKSIQYRIRLILNSGESVVSVAKSLTPLATTEINPKIVSSGGQIEYEFTVQSINEITVQVYNITNRLVFTETVYPTMGVNKFYFDSSLFNEGIYFLRLEQSDNSSTTKFFIR